ncbi:M20/M25/M40 family metallo-hydrolase [Caulobacter segnis]|uniref:M20/M25/M40 family metallo-hydrolase n=1 Tax=Caulobacter segnis TaxID=88688 RepID=UPI00240F4F54|nr:M20/M25/M40 family metallo-hydrolase [Caulobacter segnis]MDG2521758.1 M20/M25/M40 family metallo-hydrolase [Caulobacter segnis]
MGRIIAALVAIAGALLIAFLAVQPPAPKPADAPANSFSAARAMRDVAEVARAPHPTGSLENTRVRAYLAERMTSLGLEVRVQTFTVPEKTREALAKWSKDPIPDEGVNLIGVLPGRDRTQPAVLLMAHHDTVPGSPGAADDTAGVAAILETVRALKTEGPLARDVMVLLSDAEEIGLVGAEAFFRDHAMAKRVGVVVNLETRGGGGRANMFETGAGNGAMMDLYARAVSQPTTNSLSVLIYDLMPNSTDYTNAKTRGVPGFNIAFVGDAYLYHSPLATPANLDQGSLQHMGDQTLELTHALATAPALPPKTEDKVFSDLFGLVTIAYSPVIGWLVLAVAAGLLIYAGWQVRRAGVLPWTSVAGGAVLTFALTANAALLLTVFNQLSLAPGKPDYYDRLAAIPRLEIQAGLVAFAVLLAFAVQPAGKKWLHMLPALVFALAGFALGAPPIVLLVMAAFAMLLPPAVAVLKPGTWGGWFGMAVVVMLLGVAIQASYPTGGALFAWPLLLAGVMAAGVTLLGQRWSVGLAVLAVGAAVGCAYLLTIGHLAFLGVGTDFAAAMILLLLLCALLIWPLLQGAVKPAWGLAICAVLLIAAGGIATSVRLDPMADSVPPASRR